MIPLNLADAGEVQIIRRIGGTPDVRKHLEYLGFKDFSKLPKVAAKPLFSMVGYSKMDLGIVKYHFEVGAGRENFEWA